MKLLLLAVIITAASASSLLGSQKCTWGPAYWCQGYKQAKECRAIEHCKQKVWKMKPEDACQECEQVVNELKTALSKNTTQHDVIVYLEDLCDKVAGQMAAECKALVDSYAPEIIKTILAYVKDPKQVCTALGMCAAKDKSAILATLLKNSIPYENLVPVLESGPIIMKPVKKSHPLKKIDASPECILCEFVMRELDNLVSENATQQEIEAALDKVCSFLPATLSTECTDFVNEYAPAILEILSKELNPQLVCTTLKLCQSEVSKPVKKIKAPTAKPTCPLCEFIMTELDTILKEKPTQEEIENALEEVCSLLPSTIREDCNNYVKQYTPVLLELLQQIKPSEVCSVIGLCSAKPLPEKKARVPGRLDPECVLCEFVMDKLETLLKENATQAEIEAALDKVCSLLPSTISTDCKNFVNKYTPAIINLLTHAIQPNEICTELGLCKAKKHTVSNKVMVKSNETCDLCKTIVSYAKLILGNNATEEEILKFLDELCDQLPDQLKTECTAIVDDYGKMILDKLLKQTPEEICSEIGLCSSPAEKVLLQLSGKSETPCFLGAHYWCSSKEIAAKCDAVQHCKNHVW